MKIAIGNDHSAVELKEIIKEFLEEKGYEVLDLGTNSTESFFCCVQFHTEPYYHFLYRMM